jgi:hypothetical protein
MAAPLFQARRGEWIGFVSGEEILLRLIEMKKRYVINKGEAFLKG